MKVYFYSLETGVYQGEDFLDERQLDFVEGVTRCAPPIYLRGEAPVFDAATECWKVLKFSGKRPPPPKDPW